MRRLIHEQLGLRPGNFTVVHIATENWGSRLVVDCIYRHPPDEKTFRLIFEDCRRIDWYVQKTGAAIASARAVQLMTHDLGEGHYGRTARLAMTLAEIILSYDRLKIERDW